MSLRKSNSSSGSSRDPILSLYTSKKTKNRAIALLKGDRTYGQARILLTQLGMLKLHPDLRLTISGKVKPLIWDEVLTRPILPSSKNWLQEFGWLAHGFIAEARHLNSFLKLRKQFGCAYLLGDYLKAKGILGEILETHGLSLWLAEREFMLLQSQLGFEAHKQKLSAIQASVRNSLAGYLITSSSNRLEPHVTPEAFQRSCKDVLDEIRGGNDNAVFASWVELHIAPWSFTWLEHKHDMLRRCGGKTLVDRYDRTLKILSCIQFNDITEGERHRLSTILQDLASAIDDLQLTHLIGILDPNENSIDTRTDKYFEGLDALVAGDYRQCAKLAEELILEDPTCFAFYWLLAKATASNTQPISVNIPDHCVAKQIVNHLHQIALNRVAINLPLIELDIIALKLGDNHLGLSLHQFAQYEEAGLYDAIAVNQIAVQCKIDTCSLIASHESATTIDALGSTFRNYSHHTSVKLELYETGAPLSELPNANVAPIFASIARAKRFALENKHREVLNELEPLISFEAGTSNEVLVHGGKIARLQFEALIGLGLAENAADAITKHYLHNSNNLRHVPFESLIEGCRSGRWPNLRKLPCWPILILLNNGTEQDLYEAVDDLLLEHGCSSPLSIADGTIPCAVEELRIILRDVLVPRVISRGALWNRTAEDRRVMRKNILQRLYAISIADQGLVVEELSQLEHAELLENAYRSIEGPKFELNYSVVNRELAKLLEGIFARYSEYRSYEAKGGLLASEGEFLTSAREGTEMKSAAEQKTETSGLLFGRMATVAFIQFLLDTSVGINSFLGTRIRHGSLENQLTRVLRARSLLALKNATGGYSCDASVLNQLKTIDSVNRDAAIKAYVDFTHTINSLTDELVTSVLRIRVPERISTFVEREGVKTSDLRSDIGLLDFSPLFSEEVIKRLDETTYSSITSLLSEVEREFILKANAAFKEVREYFDRNVSEIIRDGLQNLENAVQAALPDGPQRVALKAQILAAKGEYAEDVKIISTWFSAAKPTEDGLGSLGDIIDMAARVVNFASNGRLGTVNKERFTDENPSSEVSRLMYEVISILLRNVIQHSRFEGGQLTILEHLINGDRRSLILRNRVINDEECKASLLRAEKAIARPYDDWALGTAPGGTGFVRIRKLLKQAGFSKVEFNVRALNDPIRFETQIDYAV